MHECILYDSKEDSVVQCNVCAHRCLIAENKVGRCGVRKNRDGKLYSLVYEKIIASHTDPIEKKPLYHFLPGSDAFSIGTVGCNLSCLFCQNYDISMAGEQKRIIGQHMSVQQIVDSAENLGAKSIAYTYNEPIIFLEMIRDVANEARIRGIRNVMVTNGFFTAESLEALQGCIDAMNIDLKSFSDQFYRKKCGARLQPVLETIRRVKQAGIWIELTTLIIPHENDSEEELQ
ncbi:MAG: AmmeMemoRadiSam system radical SAM enzyme, partial [Nanoarchaeota archaeon]